MPANLPVAQSVVAPPAATAALPPAINLRARVLRFGIFLVLVSLAFWRPLFDLLQFARYSQLYSYILLIPFVSVYLVWLKRSDLNLSLNPNLNLNRPVQALNPQPSTLNLARSLVILFAVLGLMALVVHVLRPRAQIQDHLALSTFAYVCFVIVGTVFIFGPNISRQLTFPLCFLLFMIPFPIALENAIEMFFQYTSADAASFFFTVTGTPIVRDGLTFQAPSITVKVAQECSGIRSSLVLFMTSLIAGYMFLRSPWRRATLTLAVIPLAIVRNAFRIWTLATLCHYIDPSIIRSPLHKRGGPLFFALSLIPFFALLIVLWRSERTAQKNTPQTTKRLPSLNPQQSTIN